jgi:hypothetical protein
VLPNLQKGQQAKARELKPAGHTTQPPPRVTEAGLIKELEARGIGRPSTYAAIIETIVRREYVFKKGTALVPTFTAFAVVDLLAGYLGWLVDYQFTAKMEDDLDEISNGRAQAPRLPEALLPRQRHARPARPRHRHRRRHRPAQDLLDPARPERGRRDGRGARRPLRHVPVVRRQARRCPTRCRPTN